MRVGVKGTPIRSTISLRPPNSDPAGTRIAIRALADPSPRRVFSTISLSAIRMFLAPQAHTTALLHPEDTGYSHPRRVLTYRRTKRRRAGTLRLGSDQSMLSILRKHGRNRSTWLLEMYTKIVEALRDRGRQSLFS